MNEELKITERIDEVLNVLQQFPGAQGYAQWNTLAVAMKRLADISQDVQKWEKEHQAEECEACKIHVINEEPK